MNLLRRIFKKRYKLYTWDELPEDKKYKAHTSFNPDAYYFIIDGDRVASLFAVNLNGEQPYLNSKDDEKEV